MRGRGKGPGRGRQLLRCRQPPRRMLGTRPHQAPHLVVARRLAGGPVPQGRVRGASSAWCGMQCISAKQAELCRRAGDLCPPPRHMPPPLRHPQLRGSLALAVASAAAGALVEGGPPLGSLLGSSSSSQMPWATASRATASKATASRASAARVHTPSQAPSLCTTARMATASRATTRRPGLGGGWRALSAGRAARPSRPVRPAA